MDIINNIIKKISIKSAFLFVIYFFVCFIFFIKVILAKELYFYTLKQELCVNNEKYIIESFGKLLFKNQKNYLYVQVKNANYFIYKEIDKELIRLSNNFYEQIEGKLNKYSKLYKNNGDYKFDLYFYPIYYVTIFFDLYKDFHDKITQNVIFNYSNLFIRKNKENAFVIKEIYKNNVISNGNVYLILKDKKIDNFYIVLKYKDLSKDLKKDNNNNSIDINDIKVEIKLRKMDK